MNKHDPPHDKTNKITVRPAKTQTSLGILPVWSESSQCAQWVAKDPGFLHANSEDSDRTGRMPSEDSDKMGGRTVILLVLSWGGSHSYWLNNKAFSLPQNNLQSSMICITLLAKVATCSLHVWLLPLIDLLANMFLFAVPFTVCAHYRKEHADLAH